MVGCRSCGIYFIVEGAPDGSHLCLKCYLIELMAEKIQGLDMQLETMMEFIWGFEDGDTTDSSRFADICQTKGLGE